MVFFLCFFTGTVCLVLLLLFTNIKLHITFSHRKNHTEAEVQVKAWRGLLAYTVRIPMMEGKGLGHRGWIQLLFKRKIIRGSEEIALEQGEITSRDMKLHLADMEQLIHHIAGLFEMMRDFLEGLTVKEVKWQTAEGMGDAALTGMAAGTLWTLKGGLLGTASKYLHLTSCPEIRVIPLFGRYAFQTDFSCMISFRLGHAIFTGIKILFRWRRGRTRMYTKNLKQET